MDAKSRPAISAIGHANTFLDGFKAFAFKGNIIDMAVGVIIGAAFGKIVDSLVKNLIMPLLSIISPSKSGYTDWSWKVNGIEVPFGLFLSEVVNFLIIALALYLFFVLLLGWLIREQKAEEAAPPPPPTPDQQLLMEIRDLLKQRNA